MKHLLDFEKPFVDLHRKLEDLREHPEDGEVDVDMHDEIRQLEEKLEAKKREIYSNLTAWQRVQLARHPQRERRPDLRPSLPFPSCTVTGSFMMTTQSWLALPCLAKIA